MSNINAKMEFMNVASQTAKKLAGSLTADTTLLLPYLPYLLQDLWQLGTDPSLVVEILRPHRERLRAKGLVDLGCGKGAVSVVLAGSLGLKVKGLDLMADFIATAETKAREHGVENLCDFSVADITQAAQTENNYDAVIFGAVGNVLGDPRATLTLLKGTVRAGGLIVLDEAYLREPGAEIKYDNYDYLTRRQWGELFTELDLELLTELTVDDNEAQKAANLADLIKIKKRAEELATRYPDKTGLFHGYVKTQAAEGDDLSDSVTGVL